MTTTEVETIISDVEVQRRVDKLISDYPPSSTTSTKFLGAQFDAGLAWVHFAEGSGGINASPKHQKIVNEAIAAAGGPSSYMRNPIGYGMCAPTISQWGTSEQIKKYMRPLFTGEEIWCQLFSEPGSGSDFAGLSAKGVRDGDEWLINGQKVWTTLAHLSKWGLLVVRTDAQAVKHAGLTAVIVDMQAPGVEVRPLRQITGEAEFNEVYFTDVRVSVGETLGKAGDGWRVSLTTLMNERVAIGGAIPRKATGPIREAVKLWQALPTDQKSKATQDQLIKLWIKAEVLRLTNIKDTYEFCVDLMGANGMLYGSYALVRPETAMSFDSVPKAFLRSRANSIEGGTTEVMKNILGERILGLPGDVRVDRDKPWHEVPRN